MMLAVFCLAGLITLTLTLSLMYFGLTMLSGPGMTALLLSFAVLSLAGLPPFPGFFAKLFVFKSVIASGHLVPAVIAFVGSFLGLSYYLGIVLRLFRTDAAAATNRAVTTP
mgnify:CR=1 FL=1